MYNQTHTKTVLTGELKVKTDLLAEKRLQNAKSDRAIKQNKLEQNKRDEKRKELKKKKDEEEAKLKKT